MRPMGGQKVLWGRGRFTFQAVCGRGETAFLFCRGAASAEKDFQKLLFKSILNILMEF